MNRTLKIAIADDEEIMRLFLEDMLPELGYEVVASAQDGLELVERVEETNPDLIITDIRMPRMDGVEAATEIHKTRSVPVVFISGYGRLHVTIPDEMIHVFLNKPVEVPELKSGIERAIALSQ